jgi:formate dehydrogenase assembly factor FdhD
MENSKTLFDPAAWVNVENESNQKKVEVTNTVKVRPSTETVDELAKAEAVCKELIAKGANIAESYEDYLKLGFALAQGLVSDGRDIYHQLCSQSTKYNQADCEKQWQDCLTKGNGSVTIASFCVFR